MQKPPRRDKPRPHLDAHLIPLQRALLARADALDERAQQTFQELPWVHVAAEFRRLAEELHYW